MAFTLPTIGVDQSFLEKLSNPAAGLSDIGDSIVRAKKLQMESEEQSRAAEKHRQEQSIYNNKLATGYAKTLQDQIKAIQAKGGAVDDATISELHQNNLLKNYDKDSAKRLSKMFGLDLTLNDAMAAFKKYGDVVTTTDPRDINAKDVRVLGPNNEPMIRTDVQGPLGLVNQGQPQLDTSGMADPTDWGVLAAQTEEAFSSMGFAPSSVGSLAQLTKDLASKNSGPNQLQPTEFLTRVQRAVDYYGPERYELEGTGNTLQKLTGQAKTPIDANLLLEDTAILNVLTDVASWAGEEGDPVGNFKKYEDVLTTWMRTKNQGLSDAEIAQKVIDYMRNEGAIK